MGSPSLKGEEARELLSALRTLRDAGLDPTVIEVTDNETTDNPPA